MTEQERLQADLTKAIHAALLDTHWWEWRRRKFATRVASAVLEAFLFFPQLDDAPVSFVMVDAPKPIVCQESVRPFVEAIIAQERAT